MRYDYWKGNQKMYFENGLGISLVLNHTNDRHEILVIQDPSIPDDKLVAPRSLTNLLFMQLSWDLSELSRYDDRAGDYGIFEYLTDQDVLFIINRMHEIGVPNELTSR
jgi:hypothetical protein|tara:strand:+ start:92 stop:415 length:324 start_codon:yes stop_codon:yes gene_type:complete